MAPAAQSHEYLVRNLGIGNGSGDGLGRRSDRRDSEADDRAREDKDADPEYGGKDAGFLHFNGLRLWDRIS